MITDTERSAAAVTTPMTPVPYRVAGTETENHDTSSLTLVPEGVALTAPRPGQFMMMYAFGIGEIAVSVSGISAAGDGALVHTVRAVGAVSRALRDAECGTEIGMRGPFGTGWSVERAVGRDVVIVAGGVGLAPLRPVIHRVLANGTRYGRVVLIAGARTDAAFLYRNEFEMWMHGGALVVHRTVDAPVQGWPGEVGFVTEPVRRLSLQPEATTAFLCGPEPMMRSCAEALLRKGMAPTDIEVSLERNMQCGIGWCGHCQLGPLLLCRDGPVVDYDVAEPLLRVREL